MSENQSNARTASESISSGKKEPFHIGEHTKETIIQELFSLENTKRMFRGKKWHVRYNHVRAEFEGSFSIKEQQDIEDEVKDMLRGHK